MEISRLRSFRCNDDAVFHLPVGQTLTHYGAEPAEVWIRRYTAISAAWVARRRISSRSPTYWAVNAFDPTGVSTPIETVPTGFAGVPPPGPAMPVIPTPTSAPAAVR